MTPTAPSIWNTLLPVIIGGGIGVIGGLAGPPWNHWLSRQREREKKRLEKFEEMLGLVYEHDHWLDLQRSINVFGELDTHPIDPLPRAQAIASIYFSELNQDFKNLELESRRYRAWMYTKAQDRISGNVKGLNDGFNEAYGPYAKSLKDFIRKLQGFDPKKPTA